MPPPRLFLLRAGGMEDGRLRQEKGDDEGGVGYQEVGAGGCKDKNQDNVEVAEEKDAEGGVEERVGRGGSGY